MPPSLPLSTWFPSALILGLSLTFPIPHRPHRSGNTIKGNLVVGTIKDMSGKSTQDTIMPVSFDIQEAENWVEDNVAAGSERYGYTYWGLPCSDTFTSGSFRNNTAHGCLAGLWFRASSDAVTDGCAALRNFTTYMSWGECAACRAQRETTAETMYLLASWFGTACSALRSY